jgi:purine-binding chemotaxis protein CheW
MRRRPASEAFVTNDLFRLAAQVAALRDGFHQSFAEAAEIDTAEQESLLAIRVGDDVFAIRLPEVSGLHVSKTVTRVPGATPALAGIAGFRGTILPVYSLAILLGLPAIATPRWLVIAAAAPVALAFDTFEYHMRVAPNAIRPRDVSATDQPYVRDFVPTQQFVRPILHLPAILDAIRTQSLAMAPGKER